MGVNVPGPGVMLPRPRIEGDAVRCWRTRALLGAGQQACSHAAGDPAEPAPMPSVSTPPVVT